MDSDTVPALEVQDNGGGFALILVKTQREEVHTGVGLEKGFSDIKAKLSLDNSEFPEIEWCGRRRVKRV